MRLPGPYGAVGSGRTGDTTGPLDERVARIHPAAMPHRAQIRPLTVQLASDLHPLDLAVGGVERVPSICDLLEACEPLILIFGSR